MVVLKFFLFPLILLFSLSICLAQNKPEDHDLVHEIFLLGNTGVIRLQENSESDFKEFDSVQHIIQRRIGKEKYNEIYTEYVERLKNVSQVEINEDAIESYKARFRK